MQCPKCHNLAEDFATSAGVTVNFCPGCKGLWFDQGELGRYCQTAIDLSHLSSCLEEGQPTSLLCPRCLQSPLVHMPYHQGGTLLMDWCPACYGIWLDAGALQTIQRLALNGTARSTPPREPALERAETVQDRRSGHGLWWWMVGMLIVAIVGGLLGVARQWGVDQTARHVATPALRAAARHNEQLSLLAQDDNMMELTWEQFVAHVTQYPSLRLAVVGLRSGMDFAVVEPYVSPLHKRLGERLSFVAGAGDGIHTLARQIAQHYGLPLSEIPAETSQYGPAAEPLQHRQIVQGANAMLAWVTSTSIGSLNAIALAREKRIPVYIIRVE